METVSTVLAGFQQSLLPNVEAYWLRNPSDAPEPEPDIGDEVGRLMDCYSTPEQPKLRKQRVQVGWIEERRANPKRERPTTCYYFCWNEKNEEGQWRKLKTYVPQAQMSEVWQSVKVQKRPYTETLKLIRKSGKLHHTDVPKL